MIKRLLGTGLLLALAIGILSVSIGRIFLVSRFASCAASPTPTNSPEATSAAKIKVDYYLAYPGVLPDHPFYKLKMVRDRIWLALTTNVVRKTELLLMFGDKRIGAGKVLIEGNQIPLGITTMQKGVKYLERAVDQADFVKNQDLGLGTLSEKLQKAPLKYLEVVDESRGMVNDDGKAALAEMENSIKALQQRTESF